MYKTYHCKLTGNKEKLEYLELLNHYTQIISRYYLLKLKKDKDYRIKYFNTEIYPIVRKKYPFIPAKLVQSIYFKVKASIKDKKLFKTHKVFVPITFNYQCFNIKFDPGYYNAFIRFSKINYPLIGLRTIELLKNTNSIKEIQIKKKNNIWYIYFKCEVITKNKVTGNQIFGLDINLKNISLSDNSQYSLKEYFHNKNEYRKKKQKAKIINYSKNTIHNLTTNLVNDILLKGGSKLVIEDLTNIRKSTKGKGKEFNYKINNSFPFAMFSDFIHYKCNEVGIEVIKINPKNTSKTCNVCKSLNTTRLKQSKLVCKNCGIISNADFNAARNIKDFSIFNGDMMANSFRGCLNKPEIS